MSDRKIGFISKYTNLIITTAIISLTLTLVNYNGNGFPLVRWLRGWAIAFVMLSILINFLPQTIHKIVRKILK